MTKPAPLKEETKPTCPQCESEGRPCPGGAHGYAQYEDGVDRYIKDHLSPAPLKEEMMTRAREVRFCPACGHTEPNWQYDRCPNCGEPAAPEYECKYECQCGECDHAPEKLADICPSCGSTDKQERAVCANSWHDGQTREQRLEQALRRFVSHLRRVAPFHNGKCVDCEVCSLLNNARAALGESL